MKTIELWLKDLQEPTRTLAIDQCLEENKELTVTSLSEAVMCFKTWSETDQPPGFWLQVWKGIILEEDEAQTKN